MKTIALTGSTGFVGSHALEALGAMQGVRLIAACRDEARLPGHNAQEVRVGDLRDADYRVRLCTGVDVLVMAAAWTSLSGNRKRSETHFLQPTLDLIDTAVASGVRRILFISTTSAAAPDTSKDPDAPGIERRFWPHLSNVVRIENRLRHLAHRFESVVNLRLGLFVGQRYNLGLLPILLPRLRTHLVPWVAGGETGMPLVDGRDIGQAIALGATAEGISGFEAFNILGAERPSVREVIDYLHHSHGYPRPHFSVPFALAYPFAWLMERLDPILPWDPLVTRSIIHLLEETGADNSKAESLLGYRPRVDWRDSIDAQIDEMRQRRHGAMKLHVRI